jgi:glycine cleavage system T protein
VPAITFRSSKRYCLTEIWIADIIFYRPGSQDDLHKVKDDSMEQVSFHAEQSKPSVLYQCHLSLAQKSRLAPFAGYLMPLWYSSISAEHEAVRKTAGIFDCTHMGIIGIIGPDAGDFLNLITTNDISTLQKGKAQYSYVLDAQGHVLDDIIVYRRDRENFMVVVNACNEQKIKTYLADLQSKRVYIDQNNAGRKAPQRVEIRDMHNINGGIDYKVDMAVQGPVSLELLGRLADNNLREVVTNLKSFTFVEGSIGGTECIISRTGYTGAKIGFELFVHPAAATVLWRKLLEKGKDLGVLPCGLGARDSLRIEAGLPLYGHELAGPFDISPFEAGYGWAVKLEKEFFVGKEAVAERTRKTDMQVARIELPGQKGIRPVRQDDCVVNTKSECVGWVLSCAKVDDTQIALAYVKKNIVVEGTELAVHYMPRKANHSQRVQLGEQRECDITGKVVTRFARF